MPAKISKSATLPQAFDNPIALGRYGVAGAGMVFLDGEGKTYIGTAMRRSGPPSVLKVVLVDTDSTLRRMAEPSIKWPLRIAPKDHVVTFQNEE